MAKEGEEFSNVYFLDLLPEGCIAHALSHTSPVDACRLALVAPTFRSAAESDSVWERFLPPDYQELIDRSIDYGDSCRKIPRSFDSKKELYLFLCDNPLIIDGGAKSFSLDKWSGKKCFMIAARELSITWGDTPMYWRWVSHAESRFAEVAELVNVCWLEIRGKINSSMLSPDTAYAAHLVFKSTPESYGFEHQPAEAFVGISWSESQLRTVYLDPYINFTASRPQANVPKMRVDGWFEIELGEYFNKTGEDGELEMTLKEVKTLDWKSGIIVQGIEIRPKGG